jgi:hypothetical protein
VDLLSPVPLVIVVVDRACECVNDNGILPTGQLNQQASCFAAEELCGAVDRRGQIQPAASRQHGGRIMYLGFDLDQVGHRACHPYLVEEIEEPWGIATWRGSRERHISFVARVESPALSILEVRPCSISSFGRVSELTLPAVSERDLASVLIRGKGNKTRQCPLWAQTVRELDTLVQGRSSSERVFLNRCGRPITRFGIHTLVERYAARAAAKVPSLAKKRVSPHTIRHTTATHLLRSGVDINTIRAWLGHVSITTTNVYAEVDLEMKAKALANCEVEDRKKAAPWKEDRRLMAFLRTM